MAFAMQENRHGRAMVIHQTLASIVLVAVAVIAAGFALRPRLMRAPLWRATITPLASIIGSGFLVVGPILAHNSGNWAWVAMIALCAAAYLFGAAIRHNILVVEPLMREGAPFAVVTAERVSSLALAFAYFISVAYYLNLFASFALRLGNIVDVTLTRIISSAVIVGLGFVGALRGLHSLENLEEGAVGIKLGLIAGLLATLALVSGIAIARGGFHLHAISVHSGWHEAKVVLGLIILVQGFETSRYLGHAYDGPTRVRTMRYAQYLSSAIYIAFILLITPFFTGDLPAKGGETGILNMLAPLGAVVPPVIIMAALASQLSAAVADMNGAGGLLAGPMAKPLHVRAGYIATAAMALAITWSADIYEIIVFASKAFVIYYGLQCGLASYLVWRKPAQGLLAGKVFFPAGMILAVIVLIFGIAADA